MALAQDRPVTKADIESKLRQIRGDIDTTAKAAMPVAIVAGAVVVVAVVGVAYLFGRRRGRKRTTMVEVRRV